MANLTYAQRLQVAAAVPRHFQYGTSLAAATTIAQAIGDAVPAGHVTVLRRVSLRNTHATAATPIHVSVNDGAGGLVMAYLISGAGQGPDYQGDSSAVLSVGIVNTQMVIYAGANIGAVGNYTGDYVIEGDYCFIPASLT